MLTVDGPVCKRLVMLQVQSVSGLSVRYLNLKVEYLKHRDKGPQERIKVFSVTILVAVLVFLAEFAPEEVHTEDAERYHARFS